MKNKIKYSKLLILLISLYFTSLISSCEKVESATDDETQEEPIEIEPEEELIEIGPEELEEITKDLPSRLQLHNARAPLPQGAKWFKDAGLGLFLHWGPSSSPELDVSWTMRQAKENEPGTPIVNPKYWYDNAPNHFTAEHYNPEKWMEAAKKAGFQYAILTSKHHDGYALWPTEQTDLGVSTYLDGRDLIQPFVNAVRANGMKVGFYFSGVDWWQERNYMDFQHAKRDDGWDFNGDPIDRSSIPELPEYVVERGRQMVFEVMDRYRPDIWWWDSGLPVSFEETTKYNPDMIFNNRGNYWGGDITEKGPYPGSDYVTPEGFQYVKWENIKPLLENNIPWEICQPINPSGWFYTSPRGERVYNLVIRWYGFARIRGWNGKLLLNVGPRPDGTLPDTVYDMFDKMEQWMEWGKVAVFNTKGSTYFPEKANVPITVSKNDKIWYLHTTPIDEAAYESMSVWDRAYYEHTEPGKPIVVDQFPGEIESVKLLRTGESIVYSTNGQSLTIVNPPSAGPNGLHEVIEVTFK